MTQQELERRILELEKWKNYQDSPARNTFTKDIHIRNNRRIIGSIHAGRVDAGGNAVSLPTGWTSSGSSGNCTVSHNLGTADYCVVACAYNADASHAQIASIYNVTSTSFSVTTYEIGVGLSSREFFFILMLV